MKPITHPVSGKLCDIRDLTDAQLADWCEEQSFRTLVEAIRFLRNHYRLLSESHYRNLSQLAKWEAPYEGEEE